MKVIATIQSTWPGSTEPPVEIKQYEGDNLAKAISAMASFAAADDDVLYTRKISVRIDF